VASNAETKRAALRNESDNDSGTLASWTYPNRGSPKTGSNQGNSIGLFAFTSLLLGKFNRGMSSRWTDSVLSGRGAGLRTGTLAKRISLANKYSPKLIPAIVIVGLNDT
jgi:hypothetical protein